MPIPEKKRSPGLTHEEVWKGIAPRPEWDDPDHWLKCRTNYEEVNDDVRKREVSD